MKRVFRFLAVAAFAFSTAVFSSCDALDDLKDEVAGPENTWCTMPVEYKSDDGNSSATLYATFYYTDTVKTSDGSTNGLAAGIEIPRGITVLISGSSGSTYLSALTDRSYIMKSYSSVDEILQESEKSGSLSFDNPRLLWSAIYWAKKDLRDKNNQETAYPAQINKKTAGGYTKVSLEELEGFSWKKILGSYLLNGL